MKGAGMDQKITERHDETVVFFSGFSVAFVSSSHNTDKVLRYAEFFLMVKHMEKNNDLNMQFSLVVVVVFGATNSYGRTNRPIDRSIDTTIETIQMIQHEKNMNR